MSWGVAFRSAVDVRGPGGADFAEYEVTVQTPVRFWA